MTEAPMTPHSKTLRSDSTIIKLENLYGELNYTDRA